MIAFKRVGKGTDYPSFVRHCEANKSLTRAQVAEKMGISYLQGIAFAGRLAAERGEDRSEMSGGKQSTRAGHKVRKVRKTRRNRSS